MMKNKKKKKSEAKKNAQAAQLAAAQQAAQQAVASQQPIPDLTTNEILVQNAITPFATFTGDDTKKKMVVLEEGSV